MPPPPLALPSPLLPVLVLPAARTVAHISPPSFTVAVVVAAAAALLCAIPGIEFREWCERTSGLDSSLAASSCLPPLTSCTVAHLLLLLLFSIPATGVVRGVKSQGWLSRARHRRFFPRRARTDAAAAAAVAVYPSTISGIQFRGYAGVLPLASKLVSDSSAFIAKLLIIYSLFPSLLQ